VTHQRKRFPLRGVVALLALLALSVLVAGCFNPFDPRIASTRGFSTPPPAPNSASGALRLLEWCYRNRDLPYYRQLFTDDYRFVFGATDTNGQAYRDKPWTRTDELISAGNLFQGGSATEPPASNISLDLDRNFVEGADTRPGKNNAWHVLISTSVLLNITDSEGARTDVTGFADFYLVRGDSAFIPPDLHFNPDPNRWYIERWEDRTAQSGSAFAARPARTSPTGSAGRGATSPAAVTNASGSWGGIKRYYLYKQTGVSAVPRPLGVTP